MAKAKKKTIRTVEKAIFYIQSSFNNTIITATDEKGQALAWASSGSAGFKGTRKSTPFAAQTAMKIVLEKIEPYQIKEARVIICGVGTGRESAVRSLQGSSINILSIKDKTPIPHNGCRPKKPRRV